MPVRFRSAVKGRRAHLRRTYELAGDWFRFELDYVTSPHYQPLPWRSVDRDAATRVDGVISRWDAMLPVIHELDPRSAMDIGCNVGWFSANLARLGIRTLGVEGHPPYYRTAIYAAKRQRLNGLSIAVMDVDCDNVRLLPAVGSTLVLSVWHHFVKAYGVPDATRILGELWRRTDKVLFFETGEMEMGPEFGLPTMDPDPRTWLTGYLGDVCPNAEIRHLGLHNGGNGTGDVAWRNLFAVVRDGAA